MVDILLVICILVAFAILCVAAVYLLVYYQHPDDHNEAWIPKLVVIFGFVLAGATVLMLPLDVANNEGYAGKECAWYSIDVSLLSMNYFDSRAYIPFRTLSPFSLINLLFFSMNRLRWL